MGERAGGAVLRLGSGTGREVSFVPGELCAAADGFTLHAHTRVSRGKRAQLERLCRYVSRPALSTRRLSLSSQGDVILELPRPWRDGTTRLVFEPLTFLERLSAGASSERPTGAFRYRFAGPRLTYLGRGPISCPTMPIGRAPLAPAASWRDRIVPGPRAPRASGHGCATASDRRYSWAELLRRVFAVDVLRCACGARRRVIAMITEADPIQPHSR